MPLQDIHGRPLVLPPDPAVDAPSEEEAPDGTEVPDTAPELIPCTTAFIVYLLPDGQWQVADDLSIPLVTERKPHGDDFTSGSATVMRDVQTRELAVVFSASLNEAANVIVPATAQAVIQGQMGLAQKAMEARQAQDVAAKIEADKKRRGGR